jgi:hypothetical protein
MNETCRLEIIVDKINPSKGILLSSPTLSSAFCDFKRFEIRANQKGSIKGCGKSVEFKMNRLRSFDSWPLWIDISAGSTYQASFHLDCRPFFIRDSAKFNAVSLTSGDEAIDIWVRISPSCKLSGDEIFLADLQNFQAPNEIKTQSRNQSPSHVSAPRSPEKKRRRSPEIQPSAQEKTENKSFEGAAPVQLSTLKSGKFRTREKIRIVLVS